LMEENEHPTDKRSKLLTLTETGKTVLLQSFAPMSHITETISGNLTETEKLQLLQLLQKLHTYHLPWYLGMER
ncbi:MAG: MarR family transcriptional regulator, partial [Bacteroidetes bacterium]